MHSVYFNRGVLQFFRKTGNRFLFNFSRKYSNNQKEFWRFQKKKKCFLGFRFRIYYYRGVSVCVHNSFNIKTRPDLSINNENVESVTLEIVFEKTCKAIGNIPDRPPNEHFEPFQNFLTTLF